MQTRGSIFYIIALAFALLSSQASHAFVNVGVSINIAPPELPVYEQPPVPGPGYLWTPGYWAWDEGDYYWVPGTWVEPPEPGFLWTPGYWGWNDGVYIWNGGYWGPHVGFYGGVNYGYGYVGHGYEGGYWDHGAFRYNRAYNNIHDDVHITNVYNKTVIVNENNRVSFNGGNGGVQARPAPQELAAEHEHHLTPLPAQLHHEEGARGNPELRASANHGQPPIAATARPAVFAGQGVVAAHGAVAVHPAATGPATPHPAGAGPMVPHPPGAGGNPPHPAGAGAITPHPSTFTDTTPHGTPSHGGPPATMAPPHVNAPPPGASGPAHGVAPAVKVQHAGPAGGGGPGGGHPGGGAPPPPREEHPQHERQEGH